MARSSSLKAITAALGAAVLAPLAMGQATSPAGQAAATTNSPILSPSAGEKPAPPPAPKRNRPISAEAAAALAAATPKYTPPPPKPQPKPEDEQTDMRDIDKPKNGIVRLPKYLVQEPKPVILSERAVHTEKGLTDIAMRRYMTEMDRALNRFTIPLFGTSKESRAMAMYAEDERLHNMADLDVAAANASKTDPAGGAYIKREAQKTFLRSSDFGWNGGGPK